jgi:hypothetical protein
LAAGQGPYLASPLQARRHYRLKTASLKTAKYEDAYSRAKERFFHFQEMVRDGASLRERTFAQAWREWFKEKVAEGRDG